MQRRIFKTLLPLAVIGLACGCSTDAFQNEKAPQVYRIATRQIAPDPVYNRLRLVELPDTLPERGITRTAGARISPLIHFEAKNMRLEQAAKVLAQVAQYHSYCASSIVDRRITLVRVGTIEELSEAIGLQAGIKVVVDDSEQSLRFFPQHAETPRFFDGDGHAAAK